MDERHGRRPGRVAALVAAGSLAAAASPLSGLPARAWAVTGAAPQKADAIVVLGGGTVWPGQLLCEALQRLQHGVWLYQQGYAPRLVVTGGARPGSAVPAEADIMQSMAVAMGVRPDDIVVEPRASRTYENGTEVAAIMRREGWRSALLVTNALHMRRSQMVFQRLHIQTYPTPSYTPGIVFTTPAQGLLALEETGYEVMATVIYRLRGWA